jgi:hypothetical protein
LGPVCAPLLAVASAWDELLVGHRVMDALIALQVSPFVVIEASLVMNDPYFPPTNQNIIAWAGQFFGLLTTTRLIYYAHGAITTT